MHDELGFLESKYKLIMSSVFKVLKEKAEIQVRKLTDCFELHEYTSKMANLQRVRFQKTCGYIAGTKYVRSSINKHTLPHPLTI